MVQAVTPNLVPTPNSVGSVGNGSTSGGGLSSGNGMDSKNAKKRRLVFTDIQRRTLYAIFKETKRPSKEMQTAISQQLGLDVSTVANFFMNARRRSLDKWKDENGNDNRTSVGGGSGSSASSASSHGHHTRGSGTTTSSME